MAEKVRPGALTGASGGRECLARAGKPEHSPGRGGAAILSNIESAEPIGIPAAPSLHVELYGTYRASTAGITVDYRNRLPGSPVCALARRLIEAGHAPAIRLPICRGDTLCFRPTRLSYWAALRVKEGCRERVRFVPHRERPPAISDSGGRQVPIPGRPEFSGSQVPQDTNAALARGRTALEEAEAAATLQALTPEGAG